MLAAIRQWVIKTMMKGQTGVVRTLPRQEIIELNTQITAERMMRNGINPEDMKNVNQVENAVNAIESSEKKNLAENIRSGIGSTKSAKVFDLKGRKIENTDNIMGGEEIKESDAVIKARIDADNKKGIASIKNNKMIDDAIDDASPGFADGDTKYDAELVAENLAARRGLTYDDLSPKERSKIYGEAYDALSRQRFSNRKKPKGDDPEEKADGGRIGLKGGGADSEMSNSEKEFEAYKNYLMNEGKIQGDKQLKEQMERHKKKLMEKRYGIAVADGGRIGLKAGMTKRNFLKLMGSVGAGIGAVKSGIFSGLGKGAGKEVAKEVVQQTTSSTPPPYFFKLAEKIKMMGDDATATTDRTIAKTLKSKDGKSTYLLEEDVSTGDTIIKKINKEGDEMITDVEIMELKKGEVVMGKDGKPIKTPDEYEEVTEANARIEGDVFNDPYYSDGIQVDDIIKEVDDKVPSIKYATGGLAYMLGE
jgi:hypothetical protein